MQRDVHGKFQDLTTGLGLIITILLISLYTLLRISVIIGYVDLGMFYFLIRNKGNSMISIGPIYTHVYNLDSNIIETYLNY